MITLSTYLFFLKGYLCFYFHLYSCNIEYDQLTDLNTHTSNSERSEEISIGHTNSIDWSAAHRAPRVKQNIAIKDNLDLPVLLLENPPNTLVSDKIWYTATYNFPITRLSEATSSTDDKVLGTFEEPTRSAPRITSTHYIIDATFVEWGASYTLSLECDMPHENPKCTDSKTILTLVNELFLVESPALLREAP